ncbi:hypothetical protein FACS1894172_18220 [Spirochaetia bacterium]|nr:hypothetical protein FACS1894164_13180 [Spirochaetia bacterium]GHU35882.1 hypothetical protein FACS1894172_18220 [Spirochaetia bacterium]
MCYRNIKTGSSDESNMTKPALRGSMQNLLRTIPPETFHHEGLALIESLTGLPAWNQYQTVLLFFSMDLEIDTGPLFESALSLGKNVFMPKISGSTMEFYRCTGEWKIGTYGIREPYPAAEPLTPADFPALIFVPGLAFDLRGRRLGRGKGFYDRFLAGLDSVPFCTAGVCLHCQVLPSVPSDPWDYSVDLLLYHKDKPEALHL